jgi:catechol 2,3-dioxygenase-like lactoylglutathione lyase family enzyme
MLADKNAIATIAVRNLQKAKSFYEQTLGLKAVHADDDEVAVFQSGSTLINVYRSKFAGTNQATAMTWDVGGDVDSIAKSLKERGVEFEHYDIPGLAREGDVYSAGEMRVAWFKDPDGNILSIVSG